MTDDLVRRLRVPCATADSKEAADRIDALENLVRVRDAQIADGIRMASSRISELELALREIADTKDSNDLGMGEPETCEDQNMIDTLIHIARRALERKS